MKLKKSKSSVTEIRTDLTIWGNSHLSLNTVMLAPILPDSKRTKDNTHLTSAASSQQRLEAKQCTLHYISFSISLRVVEQEDIFVDSLLQVLIAFAVGSLPMALLL